MDGHGVWQFAHIKRPSKITKYAWQKKECYFYLHEELQRPIKGRGHEFGGCSRALKTKDNEAISLTIDNSSVQFESDKTELLKCFET